MSGIAEVLLTLGYEVSGSDLKAGAITERLAKLGARVSVGHRAENVVGAKAVVVTSALDTANPEVAEARRLQIPVIPRGELLAELMRLKFGIAIAGSHGKTTTTSMVASILNAANLDPATLFFELAEKFYYDKASIQPDKGAKDAYIWTYTDQGLVNKTVPSATFNEDMALRECEHCLKLNAARGDAGTDTIYLTAEVMECFAATRARTRLIAARCFRSRPPALRAPSVPSGAAASWSRSAICRAGRSRCRRTLSWPRRSISAARSASARNSSPRSN